MSSAQSKTVCSTPNKNQSHNASPATANSTQQNVPGAPSIPSTSSTTSVTSSNSSSSGIASSLNQSLSAREENHSHANKTISTRDQPLLQNSIIPSTAPVAFAAVAKHSTSQHTANEGMITHTILNIIFILTNHPVFNENKTDGCPSTHLAAANKTKTSEHNIFTYSHRSTLFGICIDSYFYGNQSFESDCHASSIVCDKFITTGTDTFHIRFISLIL